MSGTGLREFVNLSSSNEFGNKALQIALIFWISDRTHKLRLGGYNRYFGENSGVNATILRQAQCFGYLDATSYCSLLSFENRPIDLSLWMENFPLWETRGKKKKITTSFVNLRMCGKFK